jgi:Aerotolerance regulator N-terminal
MNFVSPQFLWALSALSIPIIIHLFNFRRTKRVFFSNTRLLRQVKQETTQKRNIKRYLILASRLLFLLFLVLAFAQPFLPAKEQMTTGKNSVIYLDNSFSMSGQVAEKTRALDAGMEYVRKIVELFPADTRYRLVTNDFAPFSNSFKAKAEILDLLAQLRLSPTSRTFDEVRKRIGADLTRADIFWISDFQKSTWGAENVLLGDTLSQWHLIPVSLGRPTNVFVDSVYLESPFVISGEKNIIKAKLHNTGSRKVDGLIVKLTINNIQSATVAAVLEPESFAEVAFDLTSGLKELNEARVTFNDFPVNFDNEFYFTLNLKEKINVAEIKPDAGPTYIDKVFGNSKFFTLHSFQLSNVNYSLLDEADLVVVNGINRLDPALVSALERYQKNFGSLLFIPGEQPDLSSYKTFLRNPALKIAEPTELTELEKPDFKNPFFENVFEDRTSLLTMPKARKFLDWGGDPSAVLKFKNGQPFLSQNGKTFLLTTPLKKEFTDFYNQAIFVPVMYRLAASGKKNESKLYYTLKENLIAVRADSLTGEEPVHLVGDDEIIPSQRRVSDLIYLEIPKFAIGPGFYHVINRRDTLDLIAFNLEKKESLLDHYSGEEIKAMLGGGKNISLFQPSSADAFSNEIKERYLGTPLWKYALALALLFLLAEVLLIRFLK